MFLLALVCVGLGRRHQKSHRRREKRRNSKNADVQFIMPGIELSPEQRIALARTREAFMQFRFKQIFAKMLPNMIKKTFGSGASGRNRMKDFLMPHLMPIAVKGSDGKDEIALMPAVLQGKVPYKDGKLVGDMLPAISGSQFFPSQQIYPGFFPIDYSIIDSFLDDIY